MNYNYYIEINMLYNLYLLNFRIMTLGNPTVILYPFHWYLDLPNTIIKARL